MKTLKLIVALSLGALVTACSSVPDIASRNVPFEMDSNSFAAQPAMTPTMDAGDMHIAQVNVNAPRSLTVSEANTFYPRGDIVWRGDPIGNRYQQIEAIFDNAIYNGTRDLAGATGVIVDIEVIRFHSLTEKSRYSVGGVHNMHFLMTVRDAATGHPLRPTQVIEANLPAYGGKMALQADRRGQTQKVRVTGYLAQVIRQELEGPSVQNDTPRLAMVQQNMKN
tara:strand:+ start:1644 stop:2312 length:669 start_codon:yes stop_codon:yes gene_type:complete